MASTTARTVRLTDREVATLEQIALEKDCLVRSSGVPSWRVLVQDIAAGRLVVAHVRAGKAWESKKVKKADKPKKDKPYRLWAKFPPKWWQPGPDAMMTKDAVIEASGRTIEELLAAGMVDAGTDLTIPQKWFGWWKRVPKTEDEEPEPEPEKPAKKAAKKGGKK